MTAAEDADRSALESRAESDDLVDDVEYWDFELGEDPDDFEWTRPVVTVTPRGGLL